VVLCAAGLFTAGMRANAGRVHATIEVNAPAAETWKWVEEPARLEQWESGLAEVRGEPGAPAHGEGARRLLKIRDESDGGRLVEVESVCTAYAPPRLLAVRLSAEGEFESDQTYRLTDLGGARSRVDVEWRYRYHSPLARLMEPVTTSLAQKKMTADAARLKQLVDAAGLRVTMRPELQ